MFRIGISGRGFVICIVLCAVLVVGSLFYRWHVQRSADAEFRTEQQPVSTQEATETLEQIPVLGGSFSSDVVAQEANSTADTLPLRTGSELPDISDFSEGLFSEESVSEEQEVAAVPLRVSPHGFGPFPPVPAGYPTPNLWDYAAALYEWSPERSRDWELRERVCIKLWEQGKRSESVAMKDGLVYPLYSNTVYVRWDEWVDDNGDPVRYIANLLGPGSLSHYDEYFDNDIIPPGITVIRYDEGGIDPYVFLNLK